jgi:hypothetical protein
MCVVCVCDRRRPTPEEVGKMWKTNDHGAGVSWRETLKGQPIVRWRKGLDLEAVQKACAELPLPFVAHFRIASIGPKIHEMTHPFPVQKNVSLALEGATAGGVLFHNGTWHAWRDKGFDAILKNKVIMPDGPFSDTRMMALLAHLHGTNILQLIDEKVCVFHPGPTKFVPGGIEIFRDKDWYRVDDLLVTNRSWESAGNAYQVTDTRRFNGHGYAPGFGGYHGSDDEENYPGYTRCCRWHNCKKEPEGSGWYCKDHLPQCRKPGCTKQKLVNGEYCIDHTGDCHYASCKEKKVPPTEWCEAHQPICKEAKCSHPRVVGEKLCLEHLSAHRAATVVEGALAGGSAIVPFRGGPAVVSEGADQQGRATDGEKSVGEGSKAEDGPVLAPRPGSLDLIAEEEARWARGLNPKPFRTHLMGAHDTLAVLTAGHHGDPTLLM